MHKLYRSIEADRNASAAERGYLVWQVLMEPPSCTPKNDVLIGVPGPGPSGGRIFGMGVGAGQSIDSRGDNSSSLIGPAGSSPLGPAGGVSLAGGIGHAPAGGDSLAAGVEHGPAGGVSLAGGGGGWMEGAAAEYVAGLSAGAETPSAAVFAALLGGR
jgi:hypothetical protein